jgi:hypothetical protein
LNTLRKDLGATSFLHHYLHGLLRHGLGFFVVGIRGELRVEFVIFDYTHHL